MIQIKILIVGQLQTNCYLLIGTETKKCIIIDPGDDAEYIERVISSDNLKPVLIIATHGHFDHILAVTELKLAYKIPFFMSKKDNFILNRLESTLIYFKNYDYKLIKPEINRDLDKINKIKLEDHLIRIIKIPGHTPGSICIYIKNINSAITGDLIFKDGLGRYDFKYGSEKDLKKSIRKIILLGNKVRIYPGHGDNFKI